MLFEAMAAALKQKIFLAGQPWKPPLFDSLFESFDTGTLKKRLNSALQSHTCFQQQQTS